MTAAPEDTPGPDGGQESRRGSDHGEAVTLRDNECFRHADAPRPQDSSWPRSSHDAGDTTAPIAHSHPSDDSSPSSPIPHTSNSPYTSPYESPYIFRGLKARKLPAPRAWIKCLGRWFVTVVFIVAVYAVLIGYSDYDVMSRTQKRQFSALVTGFLIALALITLSHLTSIVVDLRWWMLSRRARSRQKISSLLRCHSMGAVVMLAFKSRRWTLHLAVAAWILLLIGSQVAYAAMPLCYSVEKTQGKALLRPGDVLISNMSSIQTTKVISSSSSSVKAQQYTANSYGTISLAFVQGNITDMQEPGTLWYSDDYLMFCDESSTWCSYIFHETNPQSLRNPDAIPVVATTNRAVNASSQCVSYPVRRGSNGTEDTILVDRQGSTLEIPLPVRGGLDQSTFITNASFSSRCGRDCGIVSVFEASSSSAWYYNCTTTMSPVSNAVVPGHELGPDLTRLATTAIALRGYAPSNEQSNNDTQFQIYPSESIYGVPLNGSADSMAFLLSRFAIGVVAVTAEANSDITVNGKTPHIGQKLNIQHWDIVHLIFGLTAGLQLVLAVAATWVSRRVVIPTGGSVAEAQVLRPMMEGDDGSRQPGNGGSDEKRRSGGEEKKKGDCWIYRDHYVGDGIYDLFMKASTSNSTNSECQPSPDNDPNEIGEMGERGVQFADGARRDSRQSSHGHAPKTRS